MNKEFIPHEQILELKALGFDGILWQEAFRWFREKHGLHHVVEYDPIDKVYSSLVRYDYLEDLPTYEEAELACLNKLIEIVKNK